MTSEGKMEIAADCRVKPVIRFSSGMEERTFPSILEAARWCVGHRGATSPRRRPAASPRSSADWARRPTGSAGAGGGEPPRCPLSDPAASMARRRALDGRKARARRPEKSERQYHQGRERAHLVGLWLPLAYAGRIEESR